MTPYLIIDGYNLMHAAGIARQRYGRGDMERCRVRMNRELVTLLSPEVVSQAVIVYDAFESVSNDNRRQVVKGLMVVFAPMGTDADTEIERLLLQHSVPKRVIVVSSDHRLHKAAGRRKARCVDSEDFWASLEADNELPPPVILPANKGKSAAQSQTPDNVVNELQKFAEEAQQLEEASDRDLPGASVFDDDYLRDLNIDLNENGFD